MPNIGPAGGEITCSIIKMPGPPGLPVRRITTWTIAGYNGRGFLETGLVPPTWKAICFLHAFEAAVDAWAVSMQTLPGKVSSITDDWTVSPLHTGLMILNVSKQPAKERRLGDGYDTLGAIVVRGTRI